MEIQEQVLLILIYIAFISLGLPDLLLGSGWPVMHTELGVPVSYMGIVSMIISGGTIISSLFSDKLTPKFGTRIVTVCFNSPGTFRQLLMESQRSIMYKAF